MQGFYLLMCPETQKEMSFEIPIPTDIQNLIKDIKKHS
jgi:hypothetical protein